MLLYLQLESYAIFYKCFICDFFVIYVFCELLIIMTKEIKAHLETAKSKNLLKPKHFCELCGIDPRNATRVKALAIVDDSKNFLVKETINNLIANNKFMNSDIVQIIKLINKNNKSAVKSIPKTEKKQTLKKRQKQNKAEGSKKEEPKVDDDYVSFWRAYFVKTFHDNQSEKDTLYEGITQAKEDMVSTADGHNAYTRGAAAKTMQILNKVQQERNLLIPQDCVNFMIGSSIEYILTGCVDLIQKEFTDRGLGVSEIRAIKNKMSILVNNSQDHMTELLTEWDKLSRGK